MREWTERNELMEIAIDINAEDEKIFKSIKCPLKLKYFVIEKNLDNPKIPYKLRINGLFEEAKRVTDVWRYTIKNKDGDYFFACREDTCFQQNSCEIDLSTQLPIGGNIVLLLESPHKDEYSKDGLFTPLKPAMGNTGERIAKHFPFLFKKNCSDWGKAEAYKLIIANPVQYQASLYEIHGIALTGKNRENKRAQSLKTKIWRILFRTERSAFLERMKQYQPQIIINACTSKLRAVVQKQLGEIQTKTIFFTSKHPSVWNENTVFIKEPTSN